MTAAQAASPVLKLACQLIEIESVTPTDGGCQAIIAKRLSALGFSTETLEFGEVTNLWAIIGDAGPLLVFAGHTDVVPPGPVAEWRSDPFKPEIIDGMLHGRGSADMKGSLAAMVVAMERLLSAEGKLNGRIGFLITSDEEGTAEDGTRKVIEELSKRKITIDYCIVGEPSSQKELGDTVRVGRRGSLGGRLTIKGKQGHVAYPDKAVNPVHRLAPALAELCAESWDEGTDTFPPTSFQVSNLESGTGADNVIPGSAKLRFNFRYSPASTVETLQLRVCGILDRHELDYDIDWHDSGRPFVSEAGKLRETVVQIISEKLDHSPECNTSGGTSDGRFIAPTGAEVIELGPVNATIHKIDEQVAANDLETLAELYEGIAAKLVRG